MDNGEVKQEERVPVSWRRHCLSLCSCFSDSDLGLRLSSIVITFEACRCFCCRRRPRVFVAVVVISSVRLTTVSNCSPM